MFATDEFKAIVNLEDDVKQELQEKFSSAPLPKKFVSEDEQETAAQNKGPATAGILEQQRITNLEIVLRKFNGTPKQIAEAVRTLDPLAETLSLDNVNALISNQIKPEELLLAKAYEGDEEEVDKLNKPEKFVYYIARVPRWEQKVKTIFTMHNSKNLVKEVTATIDNVINATKEVSSSEKLKRVLASVLAIGNYMNQGTAKGSAKGFRLDSLQKLSETKMREGGQTLLHYLASVLGKKNPEVLSLVKDMPSVQGAKRFGKEDIAKEVLTFQGCVQVMGREITVMRQEAAESPRKNRPSPPPAPITPAPPKSKDGNSLSLPAGESAKSGADQKTANSSEGGADGKDGEKDSTDAPKRSALEVAIDMHREAENNLNEITAKHNEMLTRFSDLAVFLGEDIRNAKIEELFATITNFIWQFEKCVQENAKKEADEARQARIEARKANDAAKKKSKNAKADEATAVSTSGKPVPIDTGNKDKVPTLTGSQHPVESTGIRIEETSPVSVSNGIGASKS